MADLVDLTYLRELTDGDSDMEKQLFAIFISSGEECIATLEKNCTEGENIDWRKAAHALKGSAANLGANSLAEVCAKAQDAFEASLQGKSDILTNIRNLFEETKGFLNSL